MLHQVADAWAKFRYHRSKCVTTSSLLEERYRTSIDRHVLTPITISAYGSCQPIRTVVRVMRLHCSAARPEPLGALARGHLETLQAVAGRFQTQLLLRPSPCLIWRIDGSRTNAQSRC